MLLVSILAQPARAEPAAKRFLLLFVLIFAPFLIGFGYIFK